MSDLTHLDLFSGIGGFALAAKWAGFRTIGFCEINKYCQRLLAQNFLADSERFRRRKETKTRLRMAGNILENGSGAKGSVGLVQDCRVFGDISELSGAAFNGVTLITGGFPCQPFSCAGKRRGKEDDRHLWPEMLRVIKEARPAWVLGENVTGIVSMELDNCLSDLESIGYSCRPFIIPACGVDARHRRNRVWIVAQSSGHRCRQMEQSKPGGTQREESGDSTLHTSFSDGRARWPTEPSVGRVANGVPRRVDRLKGLGNAIVPQVAYQILKAIAEIESKPNLKLCVQKAGSKIIHKYQRGRYEIRSRSRVA